MTHLVKEREREVTLQSNRQLMTAPKRFTDSGTLVNISFVRHFGKKHLENGVDVVREPHRK